MATDQLQKSHYITFKLSAKGNLFQKAMETNFQVATISLKNIYFIMSR